MTFTLAEIDRAFFEYIRLEIVKAGFLPDMLLYSSQEEWDAAREQLSQTLPNGLIEIFGVGAADDRDEWTGNKIVINRTTEENSSRVGGGAIEYIRNPTTNTFTSQFIPFQATNITYEVQFNAMNVMYERIMSDIVTKALGHKGFKNSMGAISLNIDKFFYVRRLQKIDTSVLHFLQKVVIFNVEDIFLTADSEILDTDIVPMNSITFRLLSVAMSRRDTETPIDIQVGNS